MVMMKKEPSSFRQLTLKKAALAEAERTLARREREESIRRHSELYGVRWCTEHACQLGKAVTEWRGGQDERAAGIRVRSYNREANVMQEVTLAAVLEALPTEEGGVPTALRPTAFGQVVLSPTLHLSTQIHRLLMAAWSL